MPTPVLLTLIPITVGVGIATVSDVEVNFVGCLFAAAAVLCTALAQIFTSSYQKSLECDALQLLFHTAPLIAAGMLCLVCTHSMKPLTLSYQPTKSITIFLYHFLGFGLKY